MELPQRPSKYRSRAQHVFLDENSRDGSNKSAKTSHSYNMTEAGDGGEEIIIPNKRFKNFAEKF